VGQHANLQKQKKACSSMHAGMFTASTPCRTSFLKFEAALAMSFAKGFPREKAFHQMPWLQLQVATSCRVGCNMTACLPKTQQSRQLASMLQL
jgi:hypothetical protein